MKKFTKHIVILLMFSFIISTPLNVFAKDLDKKSEIGTKVLLKAGFTQSEISDLPKSELEAYADAQSITINDEYYRITYTKELNGQTTKKRHKISKEQSEKEMASNSVYTFANNRAISKKMARNSMYTLANNGDTSMSGDSGTTYSWIKIRNIATHLTRRKIDKAERYKLSAFFDWLKEPYYRDTEVFGIGYTPNLSAIPGSEYFYYKCENLLGYNSPTTLVNKYTATKRDVGGYGFSFDLIESDGMTTDYRNHRGYMTYEAYITPTVFNGYVKSFANYAHQEKTFSITPTIAFPWGGALNLNYANDFTYANCDIQWYVNVD